MPEQQVARTVRTPRTPPNTLALTILFLGLLVSFAANVRQDRKIAGLAQDLASVRQQNQGQIAQLRDAQSALLEQDLLRLDQLTTQLQKTSQDELREAAQLTNRARAELARTVEQRHQEMITAISDLRADLRAEANARASQPNVPKTVPIDVPASIAANLSAAPAVSVLPGRKIGDDDPTASVAQKKSIWSKLNPFSRHHTSNPAN
jgi:hypothetical protein